MAIERAQCCWRHNQRSKVTPEAGKTTLATPNEGTAVAQKLADAKGCWRGQSPELWYLPAKIYSDAGIPQVSPSATPNLPRQGFKTTFRVVADDVALGGTLGRYAVNTLRARPSP